MCAITKKDVVYAVGILSLAVLIVVWIHATERLGRFRLLLELIRCDKPERVKIAEIVEAPLLVARPDRTDTVGRVAVQPAIGRNVEHAPVVSSDAVG